MKKILYSLIVCLLIVGMYSCEEDTSADTSRITYFAELTLEGDDTVLVELGGTYEEPGYVATENDDDITSSVVVSGEVDANTIGLYTLTYSVENTDGYSSSETRTIIVYDPSTTMTLSVGTYTSADGTYRDYDGTITSYSGYDIEIDSIAPGIYYCSDFLGGYYDQRAEYGSSYAMTGYFSLGNDSTLELLSSYISGWGDGLEYMEDGKYDPGKEELYWMVDYVGYLDFYVTLTKN